MYKIWTSTFLLLYFSLYGIHAQQDELQSEAQQNEDQGSEIPKDAGGEGNLRQLRIRSLQNDIATATYFELEQMARNLGIIPNKSIDSLRNSIYNKLQIPAPQENSTGNNQDLLIKIESAQTTKSFSVERGEGESEDYFTISGGVKVSISDAQEGYQHSVSADTIIFNRKQNTIRAEGKVVYIKKKIGSEKNTDTEKFTGDSLIFRLRIWRGVIFYGVFSRNQTTDIQRPADVHTSSSNPEKTKADPSSSTDEDSILGTTVLSSKDITYFFDGEKMRKGNDDILVLEKGRISTSEQEKTEYFQLGFNRLWIFGKSEWAMLSATLYVGHIPVLYLPYYYSNSNQLLFHPVFGIREAYGEFLQTTTYLLGTPVQTDTDSFSFIPINSTDSETNSKFRLNTLYLEPADADEESGTSTFSSDSYIKFLLDYYSYIGLFTGFNSTLKDFAFISNFKWEASLAYANALEERTGAGFATGKPYIRGDDGQYSLHRVESNFFGLNIPFRFGIKTELTSKRNIFRLDFEHYSDSFYRRDYLNRKETFAWIDYTLQKVQQNIDDLLAELRKKESIVSSYKWETSLNFSPKINLSFIDSFKIQIYVSAYFDKKTDVEREAYDPTREFFYPTKFFLPDTSLRISGTLWPLNKQTSEEQGDNYLPVLQDWKYQQEDEKEEEEVSSEKEIISRPKQLEKIDEKKYPKPVSFSATYSIALQNLLQSDTKSSAWNRVEDIQLNNEELKFSGSEAIQFVTKWVFFEEFLNWTLRHNLNFNVAHYFDIVNDLTASSNDLVATKQDNKISWTEESEISLKPLNRFDLFADSSITHNIKTTLYSYEYNSDIGELEGTFLDFTRDDEELRQKIGSHKLSSVLDFHPIKDDYDPINELQFLASITNNLPPSLPENILKFQFIFGFFNWSHDFSVSFEQKGEDDLNFYTMPFNYTSIFKPLDQLEIKNVFLFNFEPENNSRDPHVDKNEISFKAWWFSGSLEFRDTQPYRWDTVALSWVADGSNDFMPYLAQLQFSLSTKAHYLWKNRILYFFTFTTKWDQDLIRYNRTSSLTFDFRLSFFIHEFLNIQLSYRMSHEKLYLYYPGSQELFQFSIQRNLFEDLWNSVTFWDPENLAKGPFKVKDLQLLVIHHLKDWDFIFEFVGKPKLIDRQLTWDYALGFYLRWIPIPLIKRRTTYEARDEIFKTDAR